MDPSWDRCPVCEAAKKEQESPPGPDAGRPGATPSPGFAQKRPSAAEPAGRKTVLLRPDGPPAAEPAESPGRLAGFLVSFSREPDGRSFEIREGRHIIGSGPRADIRIHGDPAMSAEHAILLFRRGKFLFRDNLSTNGSRVNGKEAAGEVVLQDRARIQLGNTTLMLVSLPLDAAAECTGPEGRPFSKEAPEERGSI
jgi:hypothetical protein